jgi:hypothetical protein
MPLITMHILASFSQPLELGTNPASTLFLLPMLLSIAIIYKATKTTDVASVRFAKEVTVLFLWMTVCTIIAAIGIWIFAWLVLT